MPPSRTAPRRALLLMIESASSSNAEQLWRRVSSARLSPWANGRSLPPFPQQLADCVLWAPRPSPSCSRLRGSYHGSPMHRNLSSLRAGGRVSSPCLLPRRQPVWRRGARQLDCRRDGPSQSSQIQQRAMTCAHARGWRFQSPSPRCVAGAELCCNSDTCREARIFRIRHESRSCLPSRADSSTPRRRPAS